ncbi:hypothetical protein [Mesorhizobium sp. M9A.F.Ca.ET.002.03.1.2]|uniref:hypothetical protein n=1 Tax=Mesorhizobium sp. M9A.F.Ca.ET.002.03.1.2 TaxID=2493668 RepID=UPI001FDF52E7|nr:hypothetical protein [Mesorhizobium sp. M9A.F.Ca.ET.002.03.1.2]
MKAGLPISSSNASNCLLTALCDREVLPAAALVDPLSATASSTLRAVIEGKRCRPDATQFSALFAMAMSRIRHGWVFRMNANKPSGIFELVVLVIAK